MKSKAIGALALLLTASMPAMALEGADVYSQVRSSLVQLVGVNAVDLEIVLRATRAVDRDALRVAPQRCVVGQVDESARRERKNLQEVARAERQLRDRPRVNDAAMLRAPSLNEPPGRADNRFFGYGADFQVNIEWKGFRDDDSDRFDFDSLETIRRHAHTVSARR